MTSDSKFSVAVIGSKSMVGSRFGELSGNNFDIIQADLHGDIEIDITDQESVDNFFKNNRFEFAILFSAFTDVDTAEKQRDDKNGLCWQINVEGTGNIVEACQNNKKKLIFISTDFIFDGQRGPYSEDDLAGPDFSKVSWYGLTKAKAEEMVMESSDFIIMRISYPYRASFAQKEDFARKILRLYKEGSLYPLFDDQIITPTFIDDLAVALPLLITSGQSGIFHLGSPQPTTPYQFAKQIVKVFGGDPQDIEGTKLGDFLKKKNVVPRPLRGGMVSQKIAAIGFRPTGWKEGIGQIYNQSLTKLI